MAKIKITTAANSNNLGPAELYMAVTDYVFANHPAKNSDVASGLAAYVTQQATALGVTGVLSQQYLDNSGNEVYEAVDDGSGPKCKIRVDRDKRKDVQHHGANDKGEFTLALPEQEPADTTYLAPYVNQIAEAWIKYLFAQWSGAANANTLKADACKLLFGIMVLSRCR